MFIICLSYVYHMLMHRQHIKIDNYLRLHIIQLQDMLSRLFLVLQLVFAYGLAQQVQQTEPIHSRYLGISLTGTWEKTTIQSTIFAIPTNLSNITTLVQPNKSQIIVFCNQSSGQVEAQFYYLQQTFSQQQQLKQQKVQTPYIYIRQYCSKYITDPIAQFRFRLQQQNKQSQASRNTGNMKKKYKNNKQGYIAQQDKWQLKQFYTSAVLFDNLEYLCRFDIELAVQIFEARDTNVLIDSKYVHIKLKSDSINVNLVMKPEGYSNKYFYILSAISCLQIVLLLATQNSRSALYGTSEWLIIHTLCLLMFQCFFYGRISQTKHDTSLSYLIINGILCIIVAVLMLRKFEKVFDKFKSRWWILILNALLFCYIVVIATYYTQPKFWVLQSCTLLWQIVHSTLYGGAGGVAFDLIIIVLSSRIPIFYIFWADDNLMRIQPNPSIAKLIIFILFSHLLVIIGQKKLGSRLLVPKCIIPNYHDYIRWAYTESKKAEEECSICSVKLRDNPQSQQQSQKREMQQKNQSEQQQPEQKQQHVPSRKQQQQQQLHESSSTQNAIGMAVSKDTKINYAQTPCNHVYHKKCLGDWLQINLACPMCRRRLPPMSENV